MNLGHAYLLTGDAVTARTYYEKTLPLIPSEEDFKAGPVADFELFIEKGWQVEACQQELTWMQQEFETVYRFRIEMNRAFSEAQELWKKEQYQEAAQLYEKGLEAEQASARPRLEALAGVYRWAGACYMRTEDYPRLPYLLRTGIRGSA